MPTTLRRIQVTRTPEVEGALDVAARLWPTASLSERLARLAALGAQSVSGAEETVRRHRREALDRLRDLTADLYPEGYLEDLREDWPG